MKAQYTEKLLVHRVQKEQDADSFGKLYDVYIERIYRFVAIKVSSRDIAEDLTSDIFLKTWNYLTHDGKGREIKIKSFSGLVYRIARTTLVDYYRAKRNRQDVPLEAIEQFGEESATIKKIHVNQEVEQILVAVKTMKREYQEIILLRYIEELSISEIADILQKKKTNVRVTLHRAMKILQRIVKGE